VHLEHSLVIGAAPEAVWALTEDVERWPSITPTITSVERLDEGPLRVGSRARLVQPRQRPRVWTVDRLEAPNRFEWSAPLGPFTVVGGHLIEAVPEGCRNTLTVDLRGRGAGLAGLLLRKPFAEAIRQENEGFRRAAEARSA
jgi:hypothetical protein